jgi:hypothetical protein
LIRREVIATPGKFSQVWTEAVTKLVGND